MLHEELILELEDLLGEYSQDPERTKRLLALKAKRSAAIRKRYPMGTPYVHGTGADIGKHGKPAFLTMAQQKKYEKKEKEKGRVSPEEKAALSKALKRIQPDEPKRVAEPERGKVIPFRARKAA